MKPSWKRPLRWTLTAIILGLAPAVAPSAANDETAGGFSRALEPREFTFPRDHASHPDYQTEWWYFTGALETETGQKLGFQATWFRSALVAKAPEGRSRLAARDLFFFHGALTDVANSTFLFQHVAARGVANWAAASTDKPEVHLLGNRMEYVDGIWRLRFEVEGRRFHLRLHAPPRGTAPPHLLHGTSPGLSHKGPRPGQASYYVSIPRLRAEGSVEVEPDSPITVQGNVWFDHEFGADQLAEDQVGWDWFSVALDDGTDLMLYSLRREDGTVEPASSGTVRYADGRQVHLPREAFVIEVLAHWTSPHNTARYPARWRLRIPGERIDLEVRPRLADQELRTRGSTGVNYWEGLSGFKGQVGDREVQGEGYVELVGYAGLFRARI